jgi:Flp pilus assembly protein TadD
LTEPASLIDVHLGRGAVLERLGRWPEAEGAYRAALALSEAHALTAAGARSEEALGVLCVYRGDYAAALAWLENARAGWEELGDTLGQAQALIELAMSHWRRSEHEQARGMAERACVGRAQRHCRRSPPRCITWGTSPR